jgi:hypothetical protein
MEISGNLLNHKGHPVEIRIESYLDVGTFGILWCFRCMKEIAAEEI